MLVVRSGITSSEEYSEAACIDEARYDLTEKDMRYIQLSKK